MSVVGQSPASDERISPEARTALWASLIGPTIEWYDFFLYATAASLVFNQAFFPHQSSFVGTLLAFATFVVGFVIRPVGGFVFGHFGDRIGRKKTLALTMFLVGGAARRGVPGVGLADRLPAEHRAGDPRRGGAAAGRRDPGVRTTA